MGVNRRSRVRDPLIPRAKSIQQRRIDRAEIAAGRGALRSELDLERPKTRGECASGPRPCPWVACRHSLYLDINPDNGSIKFIRPDLEPGVVPESCALDVADRGPHTLEEVGVILNVTRERTRQIEARALINIKRHPASGGLGR